VKRLIKIFFFLIFIPHIAFSQSGETKKTSSIDSIKFKVHLNPLQEMQFKFDEFDFYCANKNVKMDLSLSEDPQTIWLRTSYLLAKMNEASSETSYDILHPLYVQYLENSKFDPVRYFLGMAQIGAVGYFAYKHIKKYGFLK
jgi:hypothetical protein